MKKILTDSKLAFALFGLIVVTVSTSAYCVIGEDKSWFLMIWNYFLAALPLVFSLIARECLLKNQKAAAVVFSLLWLLFFPNSPYMMTDLKYISEVPFEMWESMSNPNSTSLWLFLINIIVSVFLGLFAGMLSLREMHDFVRAKFGVIAGGVFVFAVSVLSSFGVYIGRFARVNSWDVLNPVYLFEKVISTLNFGTVIFVLIFTLATLSVYGAVYFVMRRK